MVEAGAFVDDLTSSDDLRDRGLHAADNNHRAVADVAARQVEFADTIIVWGTPQDDAYDTGRLGTLPHRLAPWAVLTRVGDSRTVDRTALAARVLEHGRHDPARPGMLGRAAEIELGPLDGPVSIVAMHQGIAFMRLRTRR